MHWNLRRTRRPSETTVLEGGKDGRSPWDTHACCPRAAAWGRSGEAGGPAAPGSDQDHSQPRPAGPLQSTNTQGLSVTVGVKGPLGPPLHAGAPKRPLQPDAAPHARITEPMLRPPDLHCRVPGAPQGTTRSIRVHASRRAPPNVPLPLLPRLRNLSSLPATQVKTLSLVLKHPTAVPSQSLLAPTSTQNPPARTCAPLTTLGPDADGSFYWVSPPQHQPPAQPPKRPQ